MREGEPLTDPEIEALWELSSQRSKPVRIRVTKEALRHPMTTQQLKVSGVSAIHAAVGLDIGLRDEWDRTLRERLQDSRLSAAERLEVARVALALEDWTPGTAIAVSSTLSQAITKTSDASALEALAGGLSAVTA